MYRGGTHRAARPGYLPAAKSGSGGCGHAAESPWNRPLTAGDPRRIGGQVGVGSIPLSRATYRDRTGLRGEIKLQLAVQLAWLDQE
jgi:hypothetical protein